MIARSVDVAGVVRRYSEEHAALLTARAVIAGLEWQLAAERRRTAELERVIDEMRRRGRPWWRRWRRS